MQFGWTADEQATYRVLDAAFDLGVNFLDTADVYSRWAEGNPGGVAETYIGNWLRSRPGRRERLVVATKVRGRMGDDPNQQGLSRRWIFQACEASLRRLGVETIDLYQLHSVDPDTDIGETLGALDDLVRKGHIRYFGCSNFPAWRVVEALWWSSQHHHAEFVSLQPHYNLVHRDEYERGLEPVAIRYRLAVLPYSPLAGGFLTGKYAAGDNPPPGSRGAGSQSIRGHLSSPKSLAVLAAIRELASARNASASQIALAWLLARPSVTSPIIGPKSVEQLEDNLGASAQSLGPDEVARLEQASAWRS
jgi:aryl-alcohol dehydrogenase-like predicted oxidoreductase